MRAAAFASVMQPDRHPMSVAAGDLDGDGDLDLAVANMYAANM